MYAGKKTLVRKGVLPRTRPARFQRAQVVGVAVGSEWRIQLPNGVSVAFAGPVNAGTLARLSQLNLRFTNFQPSPGSKLRILQGVGSGKRV